MKRDTVKTIAGLIIIGGIVVATFLYGNSQRQAQLAHDEEVKKQQEAKVQEASTASPSASPAASNTASPAAGGSANTAPVQSPASNAVQGGTSGTGSVAAATATPVPATTTPATGGSGTPAPLPDTGPEMAGIIGLGSIGVMALAVRRSRQAMVKAARRRR